MVGRAGSIPFPLYSILLALNSLPKINSLNKQTWIFNSALDQTKLSKVPMEIGHGHLCFEIGYSPLQKEVKYMRKFHFISFVEPIPDRSELYQGDLQAVE